MTVKKVKKTFWFHSNLKESALKQLKGIAPYETKTTKAVVNGLRNSTFLDYKI